ncbi:MAG: sugar phosphate isomerase/epimerase family protein [Thermoguttaceae bacterium]
MFVSASTDCFAHLSVSLDELLDKVTDIGFTSMELVIGAGRLIEPATVASQRDLVTKTLRTSRRVMVSSYYLAIEPTVPDYRDVFVQTCLLARQTQVVIVVIRPSFAGIPFNDEVDRLRELVEIGKKQGVVVALTTEHDRITGTPDAVGSLCKAVPGLSVSLDPSHYIYNFPKPRDYDSIIQYVTHLRLRDTTPKLFQAQVGQGKLEYSKLMIQLKKYNYQRALCVDLAVLPDLDPISEMRKMRLLLESLL